MKRILPLLALVATCFFAGAQTTTPAAPPAEDHLKLKETVHNFGEIAQGKPVYHTFIIHNTGSQPLVLDNVQASCGCTTPEWDQKPIPAGGTKEIKVGYNAAAEGPFDKPITITYNTNQTKTLKITGSVWKVPEGSAPANASVQFLKKQTL
jgi:hypothetical protein